MAACGKHKKQFCASSTSYHVSSSGSPSDESKTEELRSFLEAKGFDHKHYTKATSNGIDTPEEFMNMTHNQAFDVLGSPSSKACKDWLSMQYRKHKGKDVSAVHDLDVVIHDDQMQIAIARSLESHASHKRSSSSPTHTAPAVIRGRTPGVQADVEDYDCGSSMAANTIDQVARVLAKKNINKFLLEELEDFAEDSELVSTHGYKRLASDIMKKINRLKKGETLNQKFMAAGKTTDHDRVPGRTIVQRDGIEVQARIIDSGPQEGKYKVALSLIQQTRKVERKKAPRIGGLRKDYGGGQQTATSRTSKVTSSSDGKRKGRWNGNPFGY